MDRRVIASGGLPGATRRAADIGRQAASKRLPDAQASRRTPFLACRPISTVPHLFHSENSGLERYSRISRTSPYSTGSRFCTRTRVTVPPRGARIGFITFIASMTNRGWPSLTVSPTLT